MNYGALIFLAGFFALASSWCGFILTPQLQLGRLRQASTLGSGSTLYPSASPGLAQQGLQVYRANGCASCHSQQVGQTGTLVDVALLEAGTNQEATVAALLQLAKPDAGEQSLALTPLAPLKGAGRSAATTNLLDGLPKAFLRGDSRKVASAAVKILDATGAKAQIWIVPDGPDIARGWGRRRTVAEDFLYTAPVMPGSVRVGPDLANAGARLPDANWHLRHLYAPRAEVKNSAMPPYRFLFEQHKIKDRPSPEALVLPSELAPPAGYEVVPRPEALALAAYLTSLRADAPLFTAPLTAPVAVKAAATATASAQ